MQRIGSIGSNDMDLLVGREQLLSVEEKYYNRCQLQLGSCAVKNAL